MSTSAQPSQSVRRMVAGVSALGLVTTLVALAPSMTIWSGYGNLAFKDFGTWEAAALAVALTIFGQVAYVRVRHGGTDEELNFFEVTLVASILLLPPTLALSTTLTGVLIGEVLIRRGEWLKVGFNLGNHATATSASVITYNVLAGGDDPFDLTSIVSLVAALFVFTAANLALLAILLRTATGANPRQVMSEEWRLSSLMAIGSVGIGSIAAACVLNDLLALLPFAFLPALALWYAYGAAAQHAEARERNGWLVAFGGALARQGQSAGLLDETAEAIRQIVRAPEFALVSPFDDARAVPETAMLAELAKHPAPVSLTSALLPLDWSTGVAARLDMGLEQPGVVLFGSKDPFHRSRITGRTRGWVLDQADAPVLGALVAAVGSAMRAGAAFTALTEETEKLTAVVDNTSDGIAMIDDSGQIRLWSQTMARMTGVEASQLTGAVHEVPAIVATIIAASRDGQAASDRSPVQAHLIRADGEELDVSISTVRVRDSLASSSATADEASWVSILTVHDETRERRVERMKTDFVATISHELRTPITPIKGYAHLLVTRGERMAPEKRIQALHLISERADHLARLVDDLLMASRVSVEARLAVVMSVNDLEDVISQAVATFPQMAERITVTLPEQPVSIQCDRVRAIQCLANLLGNAEKYTPAGSPVDVFAELEGTRVHIHVRDHGTGIPASEQERIFERFYRREDPFTMRTGGAGLGLHIARELAMAMGGGLSIRTPAQGTGAEFILDVLTTDAPAVAGLQAAPSPDALPGYRPDPRPTAETARSETKSAADARMAPKRDQPATLK